MWYLGSAEVLVCRGRNEGSSLLCLITKVADGCKIRMSGWTGVACEAPRGGSQSVLQGWTVGMLQDAKCRDLGCFGGERAKFTVTGIHRGAKFTGVLGAALAWCSNVLF